MKITAAICTGMRQDLTALLASLVKKDCDEILIVGTEGMSFPVNEHFKDPRVRTVYAAHPLSVKRNAALREARGDAVAYIDDDAVASDGWVAALRKGFADPAVGIVTGPSILTPGASLWKRTAQLAMSSTQYSRRRYEMYAEGYVEWFNVIGANFAFRKEALAAAGGCPEQFLAQGDDMAMAFNVAKLGWKVFYSPDAFVYHDPHSFWRQVVQIHRFGRVAKRLSRFSISHPRTDPAYYLYMPVWFLFALAYAWGRVRETLFGDFDLKVKRKMGSKTDY